MTLIVASTARITQMSQGNKIGRRANGRPFARRLIRLGCQIFLGRNRAHYSNWLPTLVIKGRDDAAPGAVYFHGKLVLSLCNSALLLNQAPSKILIIGSGPSVAEASKEAVGAGAALLLNGAISLIGNAIMNPFAVAVEDERFVWRHFDMISQKVPKGTPCLLSPGVLRAICEIQPTWLIDRKVILIDDIRKPYGLARRSSRELRDFSYARMSEDNLAGISTAPDRGVFQGGSVVVSALQFALAAGAREVGLLGIDISNANGPRFYEEGGKAAFSGIARAEARILDHILLAKMIADERGQLIVNHSPISALGSIGFSYVPLHEAAL